MTLSRSSNLAQPGCTVARSQGTPLAKGAKASSNDFELQYQRALCLLPAGYLETPRHVGTALANRVGAVVSRRRGVLVVFARELAPWKIIDAQFVPPAATASCAALLRAIIAERKAR